MHKRVRFRGREDGRIPDLRPLEKGEVRTKLYGLRVLEPVCAQEGAGFLEYRVYEKPEEMELSDFEEPGTGRLLIRSDPKTGDFTQDGIEWLGMPRKILDLSDSAPRESEANARKLMRESLAEKRPLLFIVHKVPPINEYELNVRFDVDVAKNRARVWNQPINEGDANAEDFRNIEPVIREYDIVDGKIKAPEGAYDRRALGVVEKIIAYAGKTGHDQFDASYVTYLDEPGKPEFYDLRFYREHCQP